MRDPKSDRFAFAGPVHMMCAITGVTEHDRNRHPDLRDHRPGYDCHRFLRTRGVRRIGLRPKLRVGWPISARRNCHSGARRSCRHRPNCRRTAGNRTAARVLVVADNCTDETAELAGSAGARSSCAHRCRTEGQRFRACRSARDSFERTRQISLWSSTPTAVSIAAALRRCPPLRFLPGARARRSICLHPILPPADGANFQFRFHDKNLIRQRGLQRLAGRAHLTGTGWRCRGKSSARAELGGSNIVEDLALGLDLASAGCTPAVR